MIYLNVGEVEHTSGLVHPPQLGLLELDGLLHPQLHLVAVESVVEDLPRDVFALPYRVGVP